jgi:hypothetical protein
MSDDIEDIVAMARAAYRDDRLADGPLYGKLADEIERLRADRRERIATACIAGMLANSSYEGSSGTFDGCAYDAVLLADALIARLDKEAQP